MAEVAIYDMDRTITRHGTFTAFLIFWAWHRAPWRLALLPLAGLNGLAYAAGFITRKRVKELNQLLLMGRRIDRSRLNPMIEAYARRVVEDGTYREAHAAIAADKAAGRRIVLATASHAFYVEPIARRLGLAEIVATGSVWDERGRLTWRIAGENCYGPAKLDMVKSWFAAQRIDRTRTRVRFYSDHVSDAPVFDWSDDKFATNASTPLRSLAQSKGWAMIDWH